MTNEERIEVRHTGGTECTPQGNGGIERPSRRRIHAPATDILESSEEYLLHVDLPGAEPDSLEVTYENGVLTIRASSPPAGHEGFSLVHAEFELGDYERAFEIGERLDADGIEAGFKDGVLTIRLPKAKPSLKKVAITAS